jgi:hypothetical protein
LQDCKSPIWPTRLNKEDMRRTKRISIEFQHREVTITVDASTVKARGRDSEAPNDKEVCPDCGSPWITIVEPPDNSLAAGVDRMCDALRASGLHLQVSRSGQIRICKKSFEEIKEMF